MLSWGSKGSTVRCTLQEAWNALPRIGLRRDNAIIAVAEVLIHQRPDRS